MFAGCTVVTWYPITPSSSLVETMIEYMKEYRIGPDGKATFAIVQAEDELAAVGMVIGAAWAGARSMTATAGPGISLMAEFTGLAYYVEIPAVIWDIQRVGPSTGLPTRTSQGDILSTAFLSHGDTKHIMLFPCSVSECFTMAQDAFDLAEHFQTPVFVMSDLDLGMNNWMSDPFPYPEKPIDRGKVLSKEDLEKAGRICALRGCGRRRHRVSHAAGNGSSGGGMVCTRQRTQLQGAVQRAPRRFRTQHGAHQQEVRDGEGGCAAAGVDGQREGKSRNHRIRNFTLGDDRGTRSARNEHRLETDYLRLRAYPFTREVHDFIEKHDRIYVVEQNRDGQMASLLKLDIKAELTPRLRSICHIHGLPIDARSVTDELMMMEGK